MNTRTNQPNPFRVALLGCGTVGREVAKQLLAGRLPGVELAAILVRRSDIDRGVPRDLCLTSAAQVLALRPDAVIEVIGGVDAPLPLARATLRAGIPFITANKSLIARHGEELSELARAHNTVLAYEAAVGASLPVIASLRALRADSVHTVSAVLNGTCNFILDRLTRGQHGQQAGPGRAPESLADAVRAAQALGLAEPDPTADLSGRDSAEKLAIIAREIGISGITPDDIEVRGIDRITGDDCRAAAREGRAIRLLATIERRERGWRLAVEPTLLPARHPLATLPGPHNGVLVEAELAGKVFLQGAGAGPRPTAAALLGDLSAVLRSCRREPVGSRHTLSTEVPPTPTAPSHAARPDPHRSHAVRLRGSPASPDAIFDALRAARLRAETLELSRDGIRAILQPAAARAVADFVASLRHADALVLPVHADMREAVPA